MATVRKHATHVTPPTGEAPVFPPSTASTNAPHVTGYRRLNHRYERHPRNYLAFLGLAAALCCYKRLVRLTT